MQKLQADGIRTKKIAIDGHLKSLDSEISTLQAQLGSAGAGLANDPNVIMGVANDKILIRASDDTTTQIGTSTAALGEERRSLPVLGRSLTPQPLRNRTYLDRRT